MTGKCAAHLCAFGLLCCMGNGWLGSDELHAQVAAPIYPINDSGISPVNVSNSKGVVVKAPRLVPTGAIVEAPTIKPVSSTERLTQTIGDQTKPIAAPKKRVTENPAPKKPTPKKRVQLEPLGPAPSPRFYSGITESLDDYLDVAESSETDSQDPMDIDLFDLNAEPLDLPASGPSSPRSTGIPCDGNFCPYGCGAEICDCSLPCRKTRVPLWKFGGWVDAGISFNSLRPVNPAAGGGNLPVGFNYRTDNIQLNQVYVFVEKPLDTSRGWSIGGRVDALWGEDYYFAESTGLERHQNGNPKWNGDFDGNGINSSNRHGLALPQAYLELGCGCLSAKVGHFYTPIGYESVMARYNFFYSHTNAMLNGEPFTHTGVLSKLRLTPGATLYGGVHNGWNVWWRNNGNFGGAQTSNHHAFVGGMSLSSSNRAVQVAAMVTSGRELDRQRGDSFSTRTLYSVVGRVQITPRLRTVIHHDWAIQHNGDQRSGGNAEWYGISSYVLYKLNCCCDFGVRYEWFNDQNGFTIVGPIIGQTGFGSHFHAFTMGLNWRPCRSITLRPELRWDWQAYHEMAGQQPIFDRQDPLGRQNSQFVAAMDCVIRF